MKKNLQVFQKKSNLRQQGKEINNEGSRLDLSGIIEKWDQEVRK